MASPEQRLVEGQYHDALRRLSFRLAVIIGLSAIAQFVSERLAG